MQVYLKVLSQHQIWKKPFLKIYLSVFFIFNILQKSFFLSFSQCYLHSGRRDKLCKRGPDIQNSVFWSAFVNLYLDFLGFSLEQIELWKLVDQKGIILIWYWDIFPKHFPLINTRHLPKIDHTFYFTEHFMRVLSEGFWVLNVSSFFFHTK